MEIRWFDEKKNEVMSATINWCTSNILEDVSNLIPDWLKELEERAKKGGTNGLDVQNSGIEVAYFKVEGISSRLLSGRYRKRAFDASKKGKIGIFDVSMEYEYSDGIFFPENFSVDKCTLYETGLDKFHKLIEKYENWIKEANAILAKKATGLKVHATARDWAEDEIRHEPEYRRAPHAYVHETTSHWSDGGEWFKMIDLNSPQEIAESAIIAWSRRNG